MRLQQFATVDYLCAALLADKMVVSGREMKPALAAKCISVARQAIRNVHTSRISTTEAVLQSGMEAGTKVLETIRGTSDSEDRSAAVEFHAEDSSDDADVDELDSDEDLTAVRFGGVEGSHRLAANEENAGEALVHSASCRTGGFQPAAVATGAAAAGDTTPFAVRQPNNTGETPCDAAAKQRGCGRRMRVAGVGVRVQTDPVERQLLQGGQVGQHVLHGAHHERRLDDDGHPRRQREVPDARADGAVRGEEVGEVLEGLVSAAAAAKQLCSFPATVVADALCPRRTSFFLSNHFSSPIRSFSRLDLLLSVFWC